MKASGTPYGREQAVCNRWITRRITLAIAGFLGDMLPCSRFLGNTGAKMDRRTSWARRLNELTASYSGGMDGDVSHAEREMIRRAAALTVELEQMEGRFAAAGSATREDLDAYRQSVGTLQQVLQRLGLV